MDIKTCGFDTKDINSFKEIILSIFSKYAPIKKKYIKKYVLTKIVKLNIDLFSTFICKNFHYCISIGKFPNELKLADVIPVHKKKG